MKKILMFLFMITSWMNFCCALDEASVIVDTVSQNPTEFDTFCQTEGLQILTDEEKKSFWEQYKTEIICVASGVIFLVGSGLTYAFMRHKARKKPTFPVVTIPFFFEILPPAIPALIAPGTDCFDEQRK